MQIGGIKELQLALGTDGEGKPRVSESWAKALKKAAGFTGRFFDVSAVIRYLKKNPNFKISDAYKRRKKKSSTARI